MSPQNRFFARFLATLSIVCPSLVIAGCHGLGQTAPGTAPPPVTPMTYPTITTLAVSPNPAPSGVPVTLTANVTSTNAAASGNVTFYDGSTAIGTATATAGVATLSGYRGFAAGSSHTLSAAYAGNNTYTSSTSATVAFSSTAVVPPSTINAHGTLNFGTANQSILGFGAAEAFDLTYLDAHPYASEMYTALFDPTAGLNLNILRVQNLDPNNGSTGFDTDTPKIVAAANTAHGSALSILMSSWSPPAQLKSNGSVDGCVPNSSGTCPSGTPSGTLVQVGGAYDYADYATYWLNSLNHYATLGVTPTWISMQNEPDFTPTYAGCRFNPTEATYNGTQFASYATAFDAVYNKIHAGLTTPPKMIGPENFSSGQTFLDMAAQVNPAEIAGYAHHMYNVSSTSTNPAAPDTGLTALNALHTAYPTQTKIMSEYYDTPGFFTAWNIHNSLTVAGDNAYIFWQAVWPETLDTAKDQAAGQQGLIYADIPNNTSSWVFPHGYTFNDAYYALKHFSYAIKPGYVRYNASVDKTNDRISVFQSTDKKTTVIVAMNTSTTATDGLSLDLSGVTYANSTVYRSSFATAITAGERFTNIGSYSASGVSLPPQSVVTVVLTN